MRPSGRWAHPAFWALLIAALFALPLIKALQAELPPPLPGLDGPPLDLSLPDEHGASRALSELRGRVVVLTDLPLLNAPEREATFDALFRLRRRLRGVNQAMGFCVLAHGAPAAELTALLDARVARKPGQIFLLDESLREFERLRRAAGSPSATHLLLDRHGRARGVYGENEAEIDRLVGDAGALCNWRGQDPPPGDAAR